MSRLHRNSYNLSEPAPPRPVALMLGMAALVVSVIAIGVLIAVFFPIFSGGIRSAKDAVGDLAPHVTQQLCFPGCGDYFGACATTPDCTAPTAVAGAGVATDCVLGVCTATITLPGGPQIAEIGGKLCREALNDTRGGCLTSVPRVSAGLVEECVVYNGCTAVQWA